MEQTTEVLRDAVVGVEKEDAGRGFIGEVPGNGFLQLIRRGSIALMLWTLNYIKVYENGKVVMVFQDEAENEWDVE